MARKSILIIEDDEGIRSSLESFFELYSYPLNFAANGQVALDILRESTQPKPSLILLDIMMPVMDGPTFILEFKLTLPELFDRIPIFIVSAGAPPQLGIKISGFLKKPFNLAELSKIAKMYCG